MKEKWKIYALLIVMSMVCAVSAAAEPEEFGLPAVNESEGFVSPAVNESGEETLCCSGIVIPISIEEGDQKCADISGNRVVWINKADDGDEIWMYDLLTLSKTLLLKNPYSKDHTRIDGDYIVWDSFMNNHGYDVYVYYIPTGVIFPVFSHPDICCRDPDIEGSRIVWTDNRLGGGSSRFGIVMYDFMTGIETQVSTPRHYQFKPVISGDKVVWEDWRSGFQIWLSDLTTGVEGMLCPPILDTQFDGAISGDCVVWSETNHNEWGPINYDVRMYDLSTETSSWICNRSGDQKLMSIDGDTVVYCDTVVDGEGNREYRLYLYDIPSKEEKSIYTVEGPSFVREARIDDGRVVINVKEDYGDDLYVYVPILPF